jgi:hypothetical protein
MHPRGWDELLCQSQPTPGRPVLPRPGAVTRWSLGRARESRSVWENAKGALLTLPSAPRKDSWCDREAAQAGSLWVGGKAVPTDNRPLRVTVGLVQPRRNELPDGIRYGLSSVRSLTDAPGANRPEVSHDARWFPAHLSASSLSESSCRGREAGCVTLPVRGKPLLAIARQAHWNSRRIPKENQGFRLVERFSCHFPARPLALVGLHERGESHC